jgi:phenylalanyl-tRNA synthetase alpha chain
MADIDSIKQEYLPQIQKAADIAELEAIRLAVLGKQGKITLLLKALGSLPPEERKEKGAVYNAIRDELTKAIEARKSVLEEAAMNTQLAGERLDITLPIGEIASGAIHPLSQAMFEALEILKDMGFVVAEGPEIEDDFHNFSALNIPPEHPARQEQDTFYLKPDANGQQLLLRTHTSPVQIRTMMENKPPIKIIVPGRVFRSDYDQTHTPVFHQIEGLYIDKGIHMGHLKGCLIEFCRRFFNVPDLPVRFRPAYFPFTEPSAEIDIGCGRKDGQLIIGGGNDWLEVLGSGMVHPNVLKNCGLNPQEWQGFAFGMGVERFAMLKYGIQDLRAFYEPDRRWVRHYGFSAFSALMKGASA